ncbi:MAG TPA: hypothetical protein DHV85_21765 [Candidatus Accumulibacter sp.]|nr:hypothetical protein [Accumulibacter sp.]
MRHLTEGEIALARGVFGDSIDYARVTVRPGRYVPFQPRGTAMAPNGHLYMYGCYSADYSRENVYRQAHFIHELTHVWQRQNRVLRPRLSAVVLLLRHAFNYSAAYAYRLEKGRDLLSYNMEQQASIVEEFFLSARGGRVFSCRNDCDADARRALYGEVLKKFLKDPAYPRR